MSLPATPLPATPRPARRSSRAGRFARLLVLPVALVGAGAMAACR